MVILKKVYLFEGWGYYLIRVGVSEYEVRK